MLQKRWTIPVLLVALSVLLYSRSSWKGADSFDCGPLWLALDPGQCQFSSHYTPPFHLAHLVIANRREQRNCSHAAGFWHLASSVFHWVQRNLHFHTQRGEITATGLFLTWTAPLSLKYPESLWRKGLNVIRRVRQKQETAILSQVLLLKDQLKRKLCF